jgi:inward rectifier potassium channel
MATNRLINKIKRSTLLEKEEERRDLGFGTRITADGGRLINPDGTFNARRVNVSFWAWADIFHRLTLLTWPRFFLIVFAIYFIVNCFFSLLYILIGVEHLQGIRGTSMMEQFWGAFFFSAQTLTTVGYGHVAPVGLMTSALSSIESLVGVLGFATASGLVYSRFSRPIPKILFSRNSVFAPYLDINAWMFRMINESPNELVDVRVEASLSRLETLSNGQRTRRYYQLKLERNQVNFFPLSWTLVHPITEDSPLYGATEESMKESDSEFLIYVKATEETFLQQVHARYSYRYEEVAWGAKFKPMFDSTKIEGIVKLDVQKIHDFDQVSLN